MHFLQKTRSQFSVGNHRFQRGRFERVCTFARTHDRRQSSDLVRGLISTHFGSKSVLDGERKEKAQNVPLLGRNLAHNNAKLESKKLNSRVRAVHWARIVGDVTRWLWKHLKIDGKEPSAVCVDISSGATTAGRNLVCCRA